jgi:hypothetical protein
MEILNPDTFQPEGVILLDETSSTAVDPYAIPDAAGGDPVDTSGPTHHDPTPYIFDRPRFASSQTHIQIALAQLPTQLRGARRHARLDPHGLRLLPHSRLSPFPMAPTRNHSNPRSPPHSRILAPLHPPLRCYTLALIIDDINTHRTHDHTCAAQALARGMPPCRPRGAKLFIHFG